MNMHIFPSESSGDIYDITQTSDKIKDGDVLVCMSEKVIAVMIEAWPTAIYQYIDTPHSFHVAAPEVSLMELDEGKYEDAVKMAGSVRFFDLETYYSFPEVE